MKKRVLLILAICVCGLLSGCCLKHDWQAATCTAPETCAKCGETQGEALGHNWTAATCTEPETCSVCGETQGEALGHNWTAATCTEPETCSVCGETQGEALGHQWVEANYQTPKTCSVCGETQGEVLTPDFEIHGLRCNMEVGETYDYLTRCYENESYTTVGQATVTAYEIMSPALEEDALDGYEWRRVTIEVVFSDANANDYGMSARPCYEDYYDIQGHDESTEWIDYDTSIFSINWNGQLYDQCTLRLSGGYGDWTDNDECLYTLIGEYRLPVGYDGVVLGLYNAETTWEEGQYIYDVADADTLFFRLMPLQ